MDDLITIKPIRTEEATKATEQAVVVLDNAHQITITNQQGYDAGAEFVVEVKKRYKALDAKEKEMTGPLNKAKGVILDLFRKPKSMYKEAEMFVKDRLIVYEDEQERIRKEQEEQLRRQAEVEEARQKKVLEEDANKFAEEWEDEKAEELRKQAKEIHIEAPVLAPRTEIPKGVSYRKNWKFRIVDINKLPRKYMIPNEKLLGDFARATKGTIQIEGIEFYYEKIVSSRS